MITVMSGYVSPTQAAVMAGVSDGTIRYWVKTGRLPALKTPTGLCFRTEDIEMIAKARKEERE